MEASATAAPQSEKPQQPTQQAPPKKPSKLSNLVYDPLKYRVRTDIEPEFGIAYEGIMPTEAEVRFIGNRKERCFYYMYGLEICKYEVLAKRNTTFLPCKDVMDALWRCTTDNQYGKTMEEAPDYVKPMQKQFYDCFFHKSYGMEVCWTYFANMIRLIYRRPDSKLSKWY